MCLTKRRRDNLILANGSKLCGRIIVLPIVVELMFS